MSGSSVPLLGEQGQRRPPLLVCPHRLGIFSCPFQALARFPKSRRVRRRGRGGEFHRQLFGQRSPSAVTTQTGREPHVGQLLPGRRMPAARPPRAPAALPASRAADRKLALPALAPVLGRAPGVPRRPPTSGPTPPAADGAYLLTWPRRCPGVPRGKAVLRGGAPIP